MLLSLLLAAAAAAPAPPAGARVVEQVVAVLRNPAGAAPRPITLTRLEAEARVALVSRGGAEAAFRPLDAEVLRATLDWLLDEMLVADESARLRLDAVDREALEPALRRFRGRFADDDAHRRFLARFELGEEDVAASLARTLEVERYLGTRVGRGVRVGDDEVDAALRARGAAAPSREAVRAGLAEERARAQAQALIRELRARAEIRVLDPALRREPARGS
ncbi:hypothetical protein [Anaeromyxobacter sp. PSR-1]|uniref:hypothetical protein n=1 Tax=Anaeromyxobacter sp. PSR-1 TaxID=1300915 RepID=UPI0005DEC80D|nr:hypothetical protein [Anaeromyxobacter sp. PSR-1]GAO02629.1 hypothetical protein PSR1_01502 [Anaeromyxobacter sp. PSR-1]